MAEYLYKKKRNKKLFAKIFSLSIVAIGAVILVYIFFPLISWQIYFAPAIAATNIESPIPNSSNSGSSNIASLIDSAAENLRRDYTNAQNWYPGFKGTENNEINYTLSIPKIGIENAVVTNVNADLSKHLVHFNSDTAPPLPGNSIIFGHSTLPQLFNPNNYTTIFANAYKLKVGDVIIANVNNKDYSYKIESVKVVEPEDTSVLAQDYSNSYITIITCTPPGTIWKRLIIKAKLEE